MAKDTKEQEARPVFDLGDALAVKGGDPVDATYAGIDFQIRRDFTGAEVLEVSQAAIAGKGELLAEIVTTGCDPVALSAAIEKNLRDVAGRLWGQILTTAGIAASQGE
ncbi:MAG: hypothetical protein ACI39C_07465 [Dietzia sp.]